MLRQWRIDIVDTGDFYGDGTADFFWQHQTTEASWIWYLNNNYVNGWPPFNLWPDSVDWRAQAMGQISDAAVDTDNDLMPDTWEVQYFGNLGQTAGRTDPRATATLRLRQSDWSRRPQAFCLSATD